MQTFTLDFIDKAIEQKVTIIGISALLTTGMPMMKEVIQMMKDGKTVNVDGYEMSWPLYEQCAAIDLLNQKNSFTGKALLVQISRKEGNITPPFKSLQARLGNCEAVLAVEEPFWKEIKLYYARANSLFQITREWMEK